VYCGGTSASALWWQRGKTLERKRLRRTQGCAQLEMPTLRGIPRRHLRAGRVSPEGHARACGARRYAGCRGKAAVCEHAGFTVWHNTACDRHSKNQSPNCRDRLAFAAVRIRTGRRQIESVAIPRAANAACVPNNFTLTKGHKRKTTQQDTTTKTTNPETTTTKTRRQP